MAPQGLRVAAVASFVPAFPLLLAHGIVSHSPVPATGLVPLFFSSSFSLFILRRRARRAQAAAQNTSVDRERQPLLPTEEGQQVAGTDAATTTNDDEDEDAQASASNGSDIHDRFPILVFLADVIFAAAILTVLVFTWLNSSQLSGQLAMLAAYGTIPLLINVLIHLLFAVRGLSSGLALPELTRYVAWQLVPGDCPDCGHHLRPESGPEIPWFKSISRAVNSAREREWTFPKLPEVRMPDMSGLKGWVGGRASAEDEDEHDTARDDAGATEGRSGRMPQWLRRPAWLSYGGVDEQQRAEEGDDEEARLFIDRDASTYRDDEEDYGVGSTRTQGLQSPASTSAEEVVVVGKKKQRKITSPDPASDEPSW
ncbi:uncharacterized protein B0I36DRAFT_358792 [Microdochium trichocladiopsis]|uniref:Uncharacterized protein n=1 Tax=Microdochium trichocladiopsis TaxID=1682393 RepID=A0A9P8YDL0_9PEZI|nr:uncharacterized protein B0I36DRAFT_358792 [Microdochium trichocladiopsis]KAH7037041.1 hypothetical protein B0I36DRAFT_358792 [Microdochium trichocladiopsis]